MKKLVRDGKVAVLITRDYGAGWYTWHRIIDLLFDPEIVVMVENPDDDEDLETIAKYCKSRYADFNMPVPELSVVWLPEGTQFRVSDYDGLESIELMKDTKWLTA